MSLSTRRSPNGLPSSIRSSRSSSNIRGRELSSRTQDNAPLPASERPSSENKFRTQRSRSTHREESKTSYYSKPPPVPSEPSRHSVQSSVSSSSSGASSVSTAPSSIWDYVGWKAAPASSANESEGSSSPEPSQPHNDDGGTLWTRLAAAAGGLSVNVSKPWETKDELPEPDTPPGHDSRVTVALKKHYIKRVNDPRQLPPWLFSDVERQVSRQTQRETSPVPDSAYEPSAEAFSRSRNRHDGTYTQSQGPHPQARTDDDEYKGPTRATERLRAIRDARRGPAVERRFQERTLPEPVLEPEPEPAPAVSAVPPPSRVGLPGRPTRPRRG